MLKSFSWNLQSQSRDKEISIFFVSLASSYEKLFSDSGHILLFIIDSAQLSRMFFRVSNFMYYITLILSLIHMMPKKIRNRVPFYASFLSTPPFTNLLYIFFLKFIFLLLYRVLGEIRNSGWWCKKVVKRNRIKSYFLPFKRMFFVYINFELNRIAISLMEQ